MYSINMNDVLMNLGIACGSSPWNLNDRTLTLRCPDTKESENTQLSRPWGHGQEKKGHLPLGCYQKPQNQQNNQNTNEKTGTAFHEQKAFDTFLYDVISVMYIYIYIVEVLNVNPTNVRKTHHFVVQQSKGKPGADFEGQVRQLKLIEHDNIIGLEQLGTLLRTPATSCNLQWTGPELHWSHCKTHFWHESYHITVACVQVPSTSPAAPQIAKEIT